MVPGVVSRVLLGYQGWLLRCCYAVAKVPGVVARVLLCGFYVVAMVPGVVATCCYAVARVLGLVGRVHGVVDKVLLCGC